MEQISHNFPMLPTQLGVDNHWTGLLDCVVPWVYCRGGGGGSGSVMVGVE